MSCMLESCPSGLVCAHKRWVILMKCSPTRTIFGSIMLPPSPQHSSTATLLPHPLDWGYVMPAGSCRLRGAPSLPTPSQCCRRSLLASEDTALTLLHPRILDNQSHNQVLRERYGS